MGGVPKSWLVFFWANPKQKWMRGVSPMTQASKSPQESDLEDSTVEELSATDHGHWILLDKPCEESYGK